MRGMSNTIGKGLDGMAHLRQSITDILTTRKGTRVMRRDYGSELPALVDRPINAQLEVDIYSETVIAITTWEPRVSVLSVGITKAEPGSIELFMTARDRESGRDFTVDGILVQ